MNAFFASVEQRDFPDLLGHPIAITNGMRGSCIITSSYEARSFGIRTGMRVKEALQLCPHLVQRPARPKVYAKVSCNIMRSLITVCPDIEVFSVDEASMSPLAKNITAHQKKLLDNSKRRFIEHQGSCVHLA